MRRLRLLVGSALLAVVLAACGSSAASHTPIEFGIAGGNMVPYHVTIQPNGSVRVRGPMKVAHRQIHPAAVRRLRREVENAHLRNRQCSGALPDVGSQFIRVGGRTVTVHGTCDAAFTRVWNDLTQAAGLQLG